jgi:hypothetical protein
MPKLQFESVSGLGDGAYIESNGAGFFELNILYHGNGISIVRSTKLTAKAKNQAIQLAKIVLGNL